jgi:DNA-binding transcriptional regulator YiaG
VRGNEVRRLRLQFGLTQAQFAALIGCHPVSVSNWERGAVGVGDRTARLIRLLAQQRQPGRPKARRRRS